MNDKPVGNDERHFLISSGSLRLYSKLAFVSDCICKKDGISIGPDAAAGLGDILNEILCGLIQIKVLNEEIAKTGNAAGDAQDKNRGNKPCTT